MTTRIAGQFLLQRPSGPPVQSIEVLVRQPRGSAVGETRKIKTGKSKQTASQVLKYLFSFILGCIWSTSVFRRSQNQYSSSAVLDGQGAFASDIRHGVDQSEPLRRILQEGDIQKARAAPRRGFPTVSIFVAPKPYTGEAADPQRRALYSWLRLQPTPHIYLLGNHPSLYAVAAEFPSHITVEPEVDCNFNGVPLLHSMIARAQAATTDVSMIINADIIVLNDIYVAIKKVQSHFDDYILTASRWDIPFLPFNLNAVPSKSSGVSSSEGEEAESITMTMRKPLAMVDEETVREFIRTRGTLHTYGGVDLWLWNNSPTPFTNIPIPPFAFGRGKYDNWLTHEAVAADLRQVVDVTDIITLAHVPHSYRHVKLHGGESNNSFWSTQKTSSWELFANIHMAQTHGSFANQKGTSLHVPWRLMSCLELTAAGACLVKRIRPANCSCELSPYVHKTQSDPVLRGHRWACGTRSVEDLQDFVIRAAPKNSCKGGSKKPAPPGLPHTLEQLLPNVASEDKVVVLVAVTMGYSKLLMNFICQMHELQIENVLVAALDEELYEFAFLRGLPVYYEEAALHLKGLNQTECSFGTTCFRQFTKLKSRSVLRVLKAGYNVLWSDVDVMWFKDPTVELMKYGQGTFPVQSNEPDENVAANSYRRINSGFYFARADAIVIQAMEAIVAHASLTSLSEQPSFYDVLCGEKGIRTRGTGECVWTNGLRIVFLDRRVFPNGLSYSLWAADNITDACLGLGCKILHNNWIVGQDAKIERLKAKSLWKYDEWGGMCIRTWHKQAHSTSSAHTLPYTSTAGYISAAKRAYKTRTTTGTIWDSKLNISRVAVKLVLEALSHLDDIS